MKLSAMTVDERIGADPFTYALSTEDSGACSSSGSEQYGGAEIPQRRHTCIHA